MRKCSATVVDRMDDAAIDSMIRADEAALATQSAQLLQLSQSQRRELYNPQIERDAQRRRQAKEMEKTAVAKDWRRGQPQTCLTSSNMLDVLPSCNDETALMEEFVSARNDFHVLRIAGEEGIDACDEISTSNEDDVGDEPLETSTHHANLSDTGLMTLHDVPVKERTRVLRELRRMKDEAEYREELYFLACSHDVPLHRRVRRVVDGELYVADIDAVQRSKITNSVLPGPYLTLHSHGRHTRYEALQRRLPVRRSAQSIVAQRIGRNAHRSVHYPKPKKCAEAAEKENDGDASSVVGESALAGQQESHREEDSAVLRRWKHRMGVAYFDQ